MVLRKQLDFQVSLPFLATWQYIRDCHAAFKDDVTLTKTPSFMMGPFEENRIQNAEKNGKVSPNSIISSGMPLKNYFLMPLEWDLKTFSRMI